MRRRFNPEQLPGTLVLLLFFVFSALSAPVPENKVWPRPVVLPKPVLTAGVKQPLVSLRGTWKVKVDPPAEFWNNSVDPASWTDAQVPGNLPSQGIRVPRGKEFAYRTSFTVPAEFTGKRVFLRFEGVAGQTRVWVNGSYIRGHFGGYTAWNCDVTDRVSAGKQAWLTLGVTETTEGITMFNTGGILRDIKLVAVPQDYVTRFNVETDLDVSYKNAVLKLWMAVDFHTNSAARIAFSMTDPQGRAVPLNPAGMELNREQPETIAEIPVAVPIKWDAEHPNLYTLEARLTEGNAVLETVSRRIGFRKIERIGRRLLVNGKEVKLRGANHHDTYGPSGRSVPPEVSELDVKLFRDANFNFVRTSHYPPMEEFLDACDRYGMFVDDEASVAFAYAAHDKPELKPLYLNQFSEQIERDRSHPSVLMWSLANESAWGVNMQAESDYVRAEDKSRPIIFSFGDLAPGGENAPYDIFSYHYASYSRDLSGGGPHGRADKETDGASRRQHIPQPVLHDEYGHVPTPGFDELRRDPGVRNFYGESAKRFWESLFPTEGALGCAIWAGIDDVAFGDPIQSTEWGVLDTWRREKPEYWVTKKAYSPVRVEDRAVPNPGSGKPLQIPIKNWFDHANLSELRIQWAVSKESGVLDGPNVEPHSEGTLSLPARAWKDGDIVNLRFYRLGDVLVDAYNLPVNPPPQVLPGPQGAAPKVVEEQNSIVVSGANFDLTFSRETGLITKGVYKGTAIIESGPYLQLGGGRKLPEWSLKRVGVRSEGNEAVVDLSGRYGATEVTFQLRIGGQGLINTKYTLDAVPELDRKLVRGDAFSRDVGGYWEVGVAYILSPEVDRLAWHRKGLWSAYPADHIGRNSGLAHREGKGAAGRFTERPSWPWAEDEKDLIFGQYDVGGRGTNDFRSMKENIYYASAMIRGSQNSFQAESEAKDAVRLEVLEDPRSLIGFTERHFGTGRDVKLTGSWIRTATGVRSAQPGDSAELAFNGTAICWLGPKEESGGTADVYIDGKLEKTAVSLYAPGPREGSLGTDTSREVLYSKEGLANGPHTIKIVIRGKNGAGSAGGVVSIDAFKLLDARTRGPVRFIVNNEWNYPQMSWGNYVKDPILVKAGYSNSVRVRFSDRNEAATGISENN